MSSTVVMEKPAQTQQAKKKKTKKGSKKKALKRYVWFVGHSAVVVLSALSALSYLVFLNRTLVARVIYRLAFLAAALTYGFSLYQKLYGGGKAKRPMSFFAILHFPTAQYFMLSLLWLVSRHHLLKLTPYVVYSLLQAADYAVTHVIKDEAQKEQVQGLLSKYAYRAEVAVADSNMLLFLRLLLDVVLLRRGSGLSLLAMIVTFRFSMQNQATKDALQKVERGADKLLSNEKLPAKVRDTWKKAKWSMDSRETYALTPEEKRKQDERRRVLREKEHAELVEAERRVKEEKKEEAAEEIEVPNGSLSNVGSTISNGLSNGVSSATRSLRSNLSVPKVPSIRVNGRPE